MNNIKKSGDVCTLDRLGRIVIPVRLRRKFDLQPDDTIELFISDDSIILRKYIPSCIFCKSQDELIEFNGKTVCKTCIAELAANNLM